MGHGDNWHMTWSDDDRQYVAWGDGRGFAPAASPTRNNGVAVLAGDVDSFTAENLQGYPFIPESAQHWYNYGIISIDGVIYEFVGYLQRGEQTASGFLPTRFLGARVGVSRDHGVSWLAKDGSPLDWSPPENDNMLFFNEPDSAFSLISVVQHGRDNSLAPDSYVYLYSPRTWGDGMNRLTLARVHKNRILDRSAYEFFSGYSGEGSPLWTARIEDRGDVLVFPDGWVAFDFSYSWHPFVTYNSKLGKYIMAASANGQGRSAMFSRPSCLAFYVADHPWGPWTSVYWSDNWVGDDPGNRLYEPVLSPKWFSADGTSMQFIFSDARDRYTTNYKFNIQSIRITPEAGMTGFVDLKAPAADEPYQGTVQLAASLVSDRPMVKLQFQLENQPLGDPILQPPFGFEWDTLSTKDGAYSLVAVATDTIGHQFTSDPLMVVVQNSSDCAAPAVNAFRGCYYADLGGTVSTGPRLSRIDRQINFNWLTGSPHSEIPVDIFSAEWNGIFHFPAGEYEFDVVSDDGVRIYLDSELILDSWMEQVGRFRFKRNLSAGERTVRVSYFEQAGLAEIGVRWTRSDPVVVSGLMNHWPLDSGGNDIGADVAGTNHLTLNGAASTGSGVFEGAAVLDGSAYFEAAGPLTLPANDFTLSAWVNVSTLIGIHPVISKPLGGGSDNSLIFYVQDGRVKFQLNSSAGAVQSDVIPAREWIHTAVVKEGTQVCMFIQGEQKDCVDSAPMEITYDQSPLYIGAEDDNGDGEPDYRFAGAIDEIRLYGRALSPNEISALAVPAPPGVQ
jgi:hypothetical protein